MLKIFKTLFEPKNKFENLFIHIPKTGGSTFVELLKESQNLSTKETNLPAHLTNSVGNTKIVHLDFENKNRTFKEPQIFNSALNDIYIDKKIFLLARDPLNRLLSEFNFQYHILNGKNGNPAAAILNRLKKIPHSFESYIQNTEVQDYQCKFLVGRKLADAEPICQAEFDSIVNAIQKLEIFCGLTEKYDYFLNTFRTQTNLNLNRTTFRRKQTPENLKLKISKELESHIKETNKYDYLLYDCISKKIESESQTDKFVKFNIESSPNFIP